MVVGVAVLYVFIQANITGCASLSRLRVWKIAESRPRVIARLDLEVSVGWAGPSSHGLCGGNALLLSTGVAVAGNRALWASGGHKA
jgi:hypothetical protein